jgi:acyl carrier protein
MTPDTQASEIEATLREHLRSRYAGGERALALDPEDDLLQSGVIDSMGVLELTSFLEEAFGTRVEDEEIIPDNFRSLGSITRYVAEKKGIEVENPFVAGVRSLVTEAVPEDGVVLVVSHGDDALLSLDSRTAWHFPRDEQGEHFPVKPTDGAEAIQQLEAQRSLGATHIVFPEPALWWLDEYTGLRDYLRSDSGEVARSEAGVVYALPAA